VAGQQDTPYELLERHSFCFSFFLESARRKYQIIMFLPAQAMKLKVTGVVHA
jgi:hypothetical protein